MIVLNKYRSNQDQEREFYTLLLKNAIQAGGGVQISVSPNTITIDPFCAMLDFSVTSPAGGNTVRWLDMDNPNKLITDPLVNDIDNRKYFHGSLYLFEEFTSVAAGVGSNKTFLVAGVPLAPKTFNVHNNLSSEVFNKASEFNDVLFNYIRKDVANSGANATTHWSRIIFVGKKIVYA